MLPVVIGSGSLLSGIDIKLSSNDQDLISELLQLKWEVAVRFL